MSRIFVYIFETKNKTIKINVYLNSVIAEIRYTFILCCCGRKISRGWES